MARIKKKEMIPGVRLLVSKSGRMGGWAPAGDPATSTVLFMGKPGAQIGRTPGRPPDRVLPQGAIFEIVKKPRCINGLNVAQVLVIHDPSEQTTPSEEGYVFWCDVWITCTVCDD